MVYSSKRISLTEHILDIRGKICPYCLLFVKKKLAELNIDDLLVVLCDHPPAATETIPRAMNKIGNPLISTENSTGVWELIITKKK